MKTIQERIAEAGITMRYRKGAPDSPEFEDSTGYTCTLKRDRQSLTVHYYQGSMIEREPDAPNVLDCLILDASGYENARGDFDEWCSEYGYDTDSRRAERIYRAVERQTKGLKRLLADDYNAFLYKTESL